MRYPDKFFTKNRILYMIVSLFGTVCIGLSIILMLAVMYKAGYTDGYSRGQHTYKSEIMVLPNAVHEFVVEEVELL